ncbi:MAG: hypothetical protein WC477_07800 [Patescibacteria group bacterium]
MKFRYLLCSILVAAVACCALVYSAFHPSISASRKNFDNYVQSIESILNTYGYSLPSVETLESEDVLIDIYEIQLDDSKSLEISLINQNRQETIIVTISENLSSFDECLTVLYVQMAIDIANVISRRQFAMSDYTDMQTRDEYLTELWMMDELHETRRMFLDIFLRWSLTSSKQPHYSEESGDIDYFIARVSFLGII